MRDRKVRLGLVSSIKIPYSKITVEEARKRGGVADGDKRVVIQQQKSPLFPYAVGPRGDIIPLSTLSTEKLEQIAEESLENRLDQHW